MSTISKPTVESPPALVMKLDDKSVPMTVRKLRIDVTIVGLVARTTMEMTFENPHNQDLEGELTFPLPDSAALSGYGLDVDGQIVDASLVEKQRARVVFEEEVRKGVDPGLLEHVTGNQFRTRIWPIPARGTRTIRVTYVSALVKREGDAFYELPLRFELPRRDVSDKQVRSFAAWNTMFEPVRPAPEDAFYLKVSVAKNAKTPQVWDVDEQADVLGFEDQGDFWVAETSRALGLPAKVRIGLPSIPEDSVAVEKESGEYYFRIEARHDVQDPPTTVVLERIALVWDASLSRATIDKQRDFELIRSLFRRCGSVDVDLFVLRNVLEQPQQFSVVAGEVEPLLEVLAEMPYDGGTRLGALRMEDPSYDALLLFTDGLSTLDVQLPVISGVPVHVINSNPMANHPLLMHLAERTGGAWLDLTRIPVEEAAERIGMQAPVLLGIEYEKNDVSDLFPSGACRLDNGCVGISGRLVAGETEITLRFGCGSCETARRTIRLRQHDAGSIGLIGRLWAQQKVNQLSLFADRHNEEMLALGRRFHIVTPNASLLVLETLEQHLEHEIPPAPSRRSIWKAYHLHIDKRHKAIRKSRKTKLDEVARLWQERVDWWERIFDPAPSSDTDAQAEALNESAVSCLCDLTDEGTQVRSSSPAPPEYAMSMAGGTLVGESDASFSDHGEDEPTATAASIVVKPWDPDTPYLKAMKEAEGDEVYAIYLDQRSIHGSSPGFYLDCADHLFRCGLRNLALRVLTNLAELELQSPPLLRILGYKLQTEGEFELATEVFEQVLAIRKEEPQSYRDLALVLESCGECRRAAQLLWEVVTGEWDGRFPEIETVALMELNRLLERMRQDGEDEDPADTLGIDKRFVKLLDLDLRVVLSWDADLTDVDLWVVEPNNEKCCYSHKLTRMGGRLSCDFTQGYGPEEYTLHRGMAGKYLIQANYYGSSQQTLIGPATIQATCFTNFGRANEQRRTITIRVKEIKDVIDVGDIHVY